VIVSWGSSTRLRDTDEAPGCFPGPRPERVREERFFAGFLSQGESEDGGREEFDESADKRRSNSVIRSACVVFTRTWCAKAASRSWTRASNCSTIVSNTPEPATPRSSQIWLNPPTPTANQLNSYGKTPPSQHPRRRPAHAPCW
jgi:hypothetical protein